MIDQTTSCSFHNSTVILLTEINVFATYIAIGIFTTFRVAVNWKTRWCVGFVDVKIIPGKWFVIMIGCKWNKGKTSWCLRMRLIYIWGWFVCEWWRPIQYERGINEWLVRMNSINFQLKYILLWIRTLQSEW